MADVQCRQCGEVTRLPDYHGAVSVVCPSCRWREVYPARRHIAEKLLHAAGAAFKEHARREEIVARLLDRLRGMPAHEFEQFCARLFELRGYTVVATDQARAQGHALALHHGNSVTYVACRRSLGHEAVGPEELENLAGAMRHDAVSHGIFVTTGSFTDECHAAAAAAGIELIDEEVLRRQIDAAEQQPGSSTVRPYAVDPAEGTGSSCV